MNDDYLEERDACPRIVGKRNGRKPSQQAQRVPLDPMIVGGKKQPFRANHALILIGLASRSEEQVAGLLSMGRRIR